MTSVIISLTIDADKVGAGTTMHGVALIDPTLALERPFARGNLNVLVRDSVAKVCDVILRDVFGKCSTELVNMLSYDTATTQIVGVLGVTGEFDWVRPALTIEVQVPDNGDLYYDWPVHANDDFIVERLNAIAANIKGPITDHLKRVYQLDWNILVRILPVSVGQA